MAANPALIKLQVAAANASTTNDLLFAICGMINCIGYQNILVDDTVVKTLTPPLYSLFALITVEADPATADKKKVIRFTEDNLSIPTNVAGTDLGMPLGDLSIYECKGLANLPAFQMIGREAGKTHSVRVQYYG
jgi:hypothetical protein